MREPGNIPENKNFEGYKTLSGKDLNDAMAQAGRTEAWRGTEVTEGTLQPGGKLYMIVDESQLNIMLNEQKNGLPLSKLGGWSSENKLPETIQATRDVTAVTKEWKDETGANGPLYVIDLEVKPGAAGVQTRRGENGPVREMTLKENYLVA